MTTTRDGGLTGPFSLFIKNQKQYKNYLTISLTPRSTAQRTIRDVDSSWTSRLTSHLGLGLLAVDNLGWNNLGGSGLGTRAHAFGLRDDHLGDGSRGCDDGRFGPLNSLQALLTLRRNKILSIVQQRCCSCIHMKALFIVKNFGFNWNLKCRTSNYLM